ncbi:hypothetical protein GCM10012275_56570 [Longimycelium tulufanense]|uniref:Uncharacterized protein n=1 Tax=Longimycelium tulufanense TaxID=907463 RepID=A0A8J3CDQ7_9PSEU|nr:hypothetical protein [Longimycelium tulufanense]GGM78604.1 hypothetical protein GCM10012275_56570 [Longimycelium tulufanense]
MNRTSSTPLTDLAAQIATEAADLADALSTAEDVQWERPPSRQPNSSEEGRRPMGHHTDPTGDTATHEGRLALRQVITQAKHLLPHIRVIVAQLRTHTTDAITRWGSSQS